MAHTLKAVLFLAMLGCGVLAVDIDCTTMTPAGSTLSSEVAPFTITANPTSFTPGGQLTVTLSGKVKFHNFLLKALVPGETTPRGTFTAPPTSAQLKTCASDDDAVTHKGDADKESLTIQWLAPNNVDKVKFVATVVIKGKNTHHVIESGEISKVQESAEEEEEEKEETAGGSDEEEDGEEDAEDRMEEERRKTEEAKHQEEVAKEADSRQPIGAPADPTEPPKPYVDPEENNVDDGEKVDDDEDSVDPDETEDAIVRYHEELERKRVIEKEAHEKAIMDEREDYLRRMEEESPFEEEEEEEKEEEKKPEVVVDKNKDRVEEKDNEKTQITDGKGASGATFVSVSAALVLIAASLSLF